MILAFGEVPGRSKIKIKMKKATQPSQTVRSELQLLRETHFGHGIEFPKLWHGRQIQGGFPQDLLMTSFVCWLFQTFQTPGLMFTPPLMKSHEISMSYSYFIWLVVSTTLKNISQLGLLFPIYGENKQFSKPPTSYS